MDGSQLKDFLNIVWKESNDIYQPRLRPLQEFLRSVRVRNQRVNPNEPYVFIHGTALQTILADAAVDCRNERGGILVGESFVHLDGTYYVIISQAIPALGCGESSAVHFSFTEESWKVIIRDLPVSGNHSIHGWYHTHPGLGVFMSGTDRQTQKLFFNKPWQVGIVIDPVAKDIGYFYGEDAIRIESVAVYEDLTGRSPAQNTIIHSFRDLDGAVKLKLRLPSGKKIRVIVISGVIVVCIVGVIAVRMHLPYLSSRWSLGLQWIHHMLGSIDDWVHHLRLHSKTTSP
jgi:proteasome lid subunit RPN8/RPN11